MERLKYSIVTADLRHLKAIAKLGTQNGDALGMVLEIEIKDHLTRGHILVAEGNDRLYGFLEYGVTQLGHWSLYKTAVALPARNQGIGSALTKEFIRLATEAGATTRLKVTQDNRIAIAFYQKHGYSITALEQSKVKKVFMMERQL